MKKIGDILTATEFLQVRGYMNEDVELDKAEEKIEEMIKNEQEAMDISVKRMSIWRDFLYKIEENK